MQISCAKNAKIVVDKLKSLVIFLRSAQLQSFSEAARQLSMSPSAVSRAVARLEADLGIRLLQRTTRSLTLTEDGAMFYQRCQQILDELEEVEISVKQSQSQPKGTLRLNFSIALGKMHIAPRLAELAVQYPDLSFNVSFSDRISDIIEEGIDATVRVGMGGDSRLVMQSLGKAYPITCAAPSYLKQSGIPTTPDAIAQHRCVNFVLPQTGREIIWKFEQDNTAIQLPVQSYLQFDYAEALLEAAITGAGIIQAPKYIVATAIQQKKLQPVLANYASKEGTVIAIVYPQKKYLSAKVRVFIEFMMELMTELKYYDIVD
jgi:LysR family transcriptional regulator, regulator for bpeEF and oprC